MIGLNATEAADAGGTGGTVVLPLLATQLLWINLITDSAPALAMGVDPPTDDLMARKPRPVTERLIDARMWSSVIQTGVVIAVVSLLTMDFYLPGGLIAGTGNLTTARTAGFTVLVFTSLFTCFTARSDTTSAFSNLFVNPRAVGRRRTLAELASGGRPPAVPEHRLRHGAAGAGPVVAVRGDVQWCVDPQRTAKTAEARLGSIKHALQHR